jgi:hypothetical protein
MIRVHPLGPQLLDAPKRRRSSPIGVANPSGQNALMFPRPAGFLGLDSAAHTCVLALAPLEEFFAQLWIFPVDAGNEYVHEIHQRARALTRRTGVLNLVAHREVDPKCCLLRCSHCFCRSLYPRCSQATAEQALANAEAPTQWTPVIRRGEFEGLFTDCESVPVYKT